MRRLISPMELYDASSPEWQMPDFIRADATAKPGLLDGLVPHAAYNRVASPIFDPGVVNTSLASPCGIDTQWCAIFPVKCDGKLIVASRCCGFFGVPIRNRQSCKRLDAASRLGILDCR